MEKAHILYVEDDETLGFITKDQLEEAGFDIYHCKDGKSALKAFEKEVFDLAILDIMLPKLDGFSIAERIREKNDEIPLLFLSAKTMEEDRIKGFEIGADDYLIKPFSMDELILKIKVFLKRKKIVVSSPKETVQIGAYLFDQPKAQLIRQDEVRQLTTKEMAILKMLYDHIDVVVKRDDLLKTLWGKNDYFLGRSLDVFITRLRKYLSEDQNVSIETIRGIGFCLKIE